MGEGHAPGEVEIAYAPEWLVRLALESSKKTQAERVRRIRPEGMARSKVHEPREATGGGAGFEGHLEDIGDHASGLGFNAPIYSAACSYFGTHGSDADTVPLFDRLQQVILAADCEDTRHEDRYATEDYLEGQIARARIFIAGTEVFRDAGADEVGEEDLADIGDSDREEAGALTRQGGKTADPEPVDATDYFTRASAFTKATQGKEIEEFIAEFIFDEIDLADQARLIDILERETVLGRRDIGKICTTARKAKERLNKFKADADAGVIMTDTGFHAQCAEAWKKLEAANADKPFLFNYNTLLSEVPRSTDAPIIQQMTLHRYKHHVNNAALFGKIKDGEVQEIGAPDDVVSHLYNGDVVNYPKLNSVSTTPFFDCKGRLVSASGFDWETGVLLDTDLGLDVPEVPTEEDVAGARKLIAEEVLGDFPFGGKKREEVVAAITGGEGIPAAAHALALILLPFVRAYITGPTPVNLVDKPAPGTGGSLFVQCATLISRGEAAVEYAMPTNNNELGKTITAVLIEGRGYLVFDNINHIVDSPELASAITSKIYGARILGKSATVDIPMKLTWIWTGNNINMSGEIRRRCVLIDLDTGMVDPTAREHRHEDLDAYIRENRADIVRACLILCRHWIANGCQPGQKHLRSFVGWSQVMGGILDAASIKGFLGNDSKLRSMGTDTRDEKDILVEALAANVLAMEAEGGCKGVVVASNTRKGKGKNPSTGYVSVIDTLNAFTDDDGEPLRINDWGYDKDTGTYDNSAKIGKKFPAVAKKPYRVEVEGLTYEVRFKDTHPDGSPVKETSRNIAAYLIEVTAVR